MKSDMFLLHVTLDGFTLLIPGLGDGEKIALYMAQGREAASLLAACATSITCNNRSVEDGVRTFPAEDMWPDVQKWISAPVARCPNVQQATV